MDPYQVHQIKNQDDKYFDEFWRIYNTSFPHNEKRALDQQTAVFNKPEWQLNVFISDNRLFGFISFWTATEFIFIEHLAIAPEFRNRGLGKTILKPFLENNSKPVILEIELPADTNTRRRLRFYESLGFQKNDHNHCQPPYHSGDKPIPMKILSFPGFISISDYQQFAKFQKEIVMA
jgi:ribosomal protein S18 acetylase RimI-like enzyme